MPFLIEKTTADRDSINFNNLIKLSDGKVFVVFDTTPKISESSVVVYNQKGIPQLPTAINYYDNNAARIFTISDIKFVSRTRQEATNNNNAVYYLRYLTKPNFGASGNGLPPKVLLFSGYNAYGEGNGAINQIPVVITNFEIDWPNDCDLIPDAQLSSTPIVRTGSITLLEMHSPKQIAEFDLEQFKEGRYLGW